MNYQSATHWAQAMLAHKQAVILDTETTGLSNTDEIVQLAILRVDGEVLYDSLLKPTCPIPSQVSKLHGIYDHHLTHAPTLDREWEAIKSILTPSQVIIYNSGFDIRLLEQSLTAYRLPAMWIMGLQTHCAMRRYSAYLGVSKWMKLEGGDHSALGDCRATLALVKKIADGPVQEPIRNPLLVQRFGR